MGQFKWFVATLAMYALSLLGRERPVALPTIVAVGLVALYRRNTVHGRGPSSGFLEEKGDAHLVTKMNDSIHQLHKPSGSSNMQVIFFHGHPFEDFSEPHLSTWECGDGSKSLWPQTWLVEEFPGAQILTVTYSEGLKRGSAGSIDMHIIGENLASDLVMEDIGRDPYCPVVLVGHSFGGLVIKKLCLHVHQSFNRMEDAKLKAFLDSVRGICFYSVPHRGSPYVDKMADHLDSRLFDYFKTLSTDTARLNDKFDRLCKFKYPKWLFQELGEGRPVKSGPLQGLFIAPEASTRGGSNFNIVPTADHFSISKPEDKKSRGFKALTNLLRQIAQNLEGEIKRREEIRKQEERIENLQPLPEHLIVIDSQVMHVKSMLENLKEKMLGIVGIGGSGKTTLAMVIFNELSPTFEFSCFVRDMKLITGSSYNVKKIVWDHMHCHGKKAGEKEEWSKLRGKRLLLVFDDISENDRDTEILFEIARDVSPESCFIVTSRDRDQLKLPFKIYNISLLDKNNPEKLFKSLAFPNQVIPPRLGIVMKNIVEKCNGLPLTLVVLGKYLQQNENIDDWQQTLEALNKAEETGSLEEKLWKKLRLSYDGLKENEQQMFLDATTFFANKKDSANNWTLREAKAAWRQAYNCSESLLWKTLVGRFLVYNVAEDESIRVHEQLQSLGRRIASEEENNGRCRVLEKTTAGSLLQTIRQWDNKEIHALQLVKQASDIEGIHIASQSVNRLKKLRYLEVNAPVIIDQAQSDQPVPSKLVVLKCVGLQSFPRQQDSLVILKLSHYNLTCLPSFVGQFSALRIFILSDSNLDNMPDEIGWLKELEHMECQNCRHLKTLPGTVGGLSKLKRLKFEDCDELHSLPEPFGTLFALEDLVFLRCYKLCGLPDSFGDLRALKRVVFRRCKILRELPSSFRLVALEHLEFHECGKLQLLPLSFGSLSALKKLELKNCTELTALPNSLVGLCKLQHVQLLNCEVSTLPESFGYLSALKRLDISYLKYELPKSFGNLSALEHLEFHNCDWEVLPESFGNLSSLKHLCFKLCSGLQALPESFGNLSSLQHLCFTWCWGLGVLPKSFGDLSSLRYLHCHCNLLQALPDSFGGLSALEHLEFIECFDLHYLPDLFGDLSALKHLQFRSCRKLHALPESFGRLSALEHVEFNHCLELQYIPESFGDLSALKHLQFKTCMKMHALPESFGRLSALEHLEFNVCRELQYIPESFGELSALKHLQFQRCENLRALPESLGCLSALEHLEFNLCGELQYVPESFGNLSALKHLQFQSCQKLHVLPDSFSKLKALVQLTFFKCPEVKALPGFGQLLALNNLDLSLCNLQSLPESLGQLENLQYLRISGCESLAGINELPDSLGGLLALRHLVVDGICITEIPNYIENLRSLHTLEIGMLPYVKELPHWLGVTSRKPLALWHKIFQVRNGGYRFARDKISTSSWRVIQSLHQKMMEKVRALDYEGALEDVFACSRGVLQPEQHGLLLQERGILKRKMGDLPGAKEDLITALGVLFTAYDDRKHRDFVDALLRVLKGEVALHELLSPAYSS